MDKTTRKLLGFVFAFLFPPLGVILGGGNFTDLIINIVLTMAFWLPGFVHAAYVVMRENP